MTRAAILLCLFPLLGVALSGCVVSRRAAISLPPLPTAPASVHPASATILPRPVWLLWTFDGDKLDVVESYQDLSAPVWRDIPGPYLTLDTGTELSYFVPVTGYGGPTAFFRIRRVWGNPWVNTPKTESKTETEK